MTPSEMVSGRRSVQSMAAHYGKKQFNEEVGKSYGILAHAIVASGLLLAVNGFSHAEGEKELPVFRRAEIAKHNKLTDAWVTYQGNVYDITPFIKNHPGGHEKILLAAGGDVEGYWNLYRQHYNTPTAIETLSKHLIGSLHPDDQEAEEAAREAQEAASGSSGDPYERDPVLSPIMRVISKQPINAEAPSALLTDSFITPTELFFVRNHHPVPQLDAATHQLRLTLQTGDTKARKYDDVKALSLSDLKRRYPAKTVTTSIQCGGNRRLEMTELEKTNGASWQVSAISTAKWTGVSLRDLLLQDLFPLYNIDEASVFDGTCPYQHVHFVGADGMEASVPLRKALQRDGDCVLAYQMNDAPLPAKHGAPLRAIVPGHVGVRQVKWVSEVRLSHEEAYGTWQRGMAYKGFGPSVKSLENVDIEAIPSLQEQPVQSAITSSSSASSSSGSFLVPGAPFSLQGYAYSGGGRGIVRVDVSFDRGQSWQAATLTAGSEQPLHRAWAWTLWKIDGVVPQDAKVGSELEVICKATDAAYNVQPDSVQGIWNLRGINNNAWHRVRLPIAAPPAVSSSSSTSFSP